MLGYFEFFSYYHNLHASYRVAHFLYTLEMRLIAVFTACVIHGASLPPQINSEIVGGPACHSVFTDTLHK